MQPQKKESIDYLKIDNRSIILEDKSEFATVYGKFTQIGNRDAKKHHYDPHEPHSALHNPNKDNSMIIPSFG